MRTIKKNCINGHEVHISRMKCPECGIGKFEKVYNTCENCKESFPVRQKIGGKALTAYNRKYCYTCSPPRSMKYWDYMSPAKEKVCSCCKEKKPLEEYVKERISVTGRQLYSVWCKRCKSSYSVHLRRRYKQDMVDYKGGECSHCGYAKCLSALDFHHVDPSKKEFSLKEYTTRKLSAVCKKELDKCILLCATCHRAEHDRLFLKDRDFSRFKKENK